MKTSHWWLAVLCAFTACTSTPPISYYSLDMRPSGRSDVPGTLQIEGVRTAESLARSQIQILATPTRIEYYATHEWAGSLGEMVRRKLEAELPSTGRGPRTLKLSGTLLECCQVDGPNGPVARMSLSAAIRDANQPSFKAPLVEKTYSSTEPMNAASPDAAAQALSRCTENIAALIAADIQTLPS